MGGRIRFHADTLIALTGADMTAKLDGAAHRIPIGPHIQHQAGKRPLPRRSIEGRHPRLPRRAGQLRHPALSRQSQHLRPRRLRWQRRPRPACRRRHPHRPKGSRNSSPARKPARQLRPCTHPRVASRRPLRPTHRARILHRRRHRAMIFSTPWKVHYQSDRTGVRLIGPKPEMGSSRRRRSRPPSLEHPRQRLRHRHHRLHRRHAHPPRPRWPLARRLRLSRHHRAGGTLEARPVQSRRHRHASSASPNAQAEAMEQQQDAFLADFTHPPPALPSLLAHQSPQSSPASPTATTAMTFRADGDKYLLVEYGKLDPRPQTPLPRPRP